MSLSIIADCILIRYSIPTFTTSITNHALVHNSRQKKCFVNDFLGGRGAERFLHAATSKYSHKKMATERGGFVAPCPPLRGFWVRYCTIHCNRFAPKTVAPKTVAPKTVSSKTVSPQTVSSKNVSPKTASFKIVIPPDCCTQK